MEQQTIITEVVKQGFSIVLLAVAIWYFYNESLRQKTEIKELRGKFEDYISKDHITCVDVVKENSQVLKENSQVIKTFVNHLETLFHIPTRPL